MTNLKTVCDLKSLKTLKMESTSFSKTLKQHKFSFGLTLKDQIRNLVSLRSPKNTGTPSCFQKSPVVQKKFIPVKSMEAAEEKPPEAKEPLRIKGKQGTEQNSPLAFLNLMSDDEIISNEDDSNNCKDRPISF